MTDTVGNSLLLSVLREIRAEQNNQRTLLLQTVDYLRRMEQRLDARITALEARIVALRDDLELMLKMKLMGRLAQFETRIDERLAALEER